MKVEFTDKPETRLVVTPERPGDDVLIASLAFQAGLMTMTSPKPLTEEQVAGRLMRRKVRIVGDNADRLVYLVGFDRHADKPATPNWTLSPTDAAIWSLGTAVGIMGNLRRGGDTVFLDVVGEGDDE